MIYLFYCTEDESDVEPDEFADFLTELLNSDDCEEYLNYIVTQRFEDVIEPIPQ